MHVIIPFFICGEYRTAETTACLLDRNGQIMMLVQADRQPSVPSDPESQLVASAIAAFAENNRIRVDDLGLTPLDNMIFPAMTFVNAYPTFYKITVSKALSEGVKLGHYDYPNGHPIAIDVFKYIPPHGGSGFRSLKYRREILAYMQAFREHVVPLWSQT